MNINQNIKANLAKSLLKENDVGLDELFNLNILKNKALKEIVGGSVFASGGLQLKIGGIHIQAKKQNILDAGIHRVDFPFAFLNDDDIFIFLTVEEKNNAEAKVAYNLLDKDGFSIDCSTVDVGTVGVYQWLAIGRSA